MRNRDFKGPFGLDADAGIETESAAVIPCEHVLGVMGLEQTVATAVTKHPGADGVLANAGRVSRPGWAVTDSARPPALDLDILVCSFRSIPSRCGSLLGRS
jgi:hypothetical protein